MRILIAEDDPDMLSLLGTLLELEGYEVGYYDEQTPIMHKVLAFEPNALLMDIHLANENGLEVSRAIRRHHPKLATRIVLQSGMDLDDASKAAHADAFLLKPYMPETLLDLLKGLLALE